VSNITNILKPKIDLKKIFYTKNKKSFFSFCIDCDDISYRDVITNEIIQKDDVYTVHYNYSNIPVVKYYYKLFQQKKSKTMFLLSEEIENEAILDSCLRILRFFKISYRELHENKSQRSLIQSVIKKRYSYLSRYVSQITLDLFEKQTKKITNIKDILTFLPIEIFNQKQPFWCIDLKEHSFYTKDFNIVMYNNINAETTEALDLLDLSIADVIEDFNKTKEKVEKKLEEKIREQQIFIEDTRNAKLRSALTEIISNRLNESKQALQEELEEATNYNDKDVLQEITYIQESLTTLEANIFKDIESVTINTNLEKWWPELLLPLPSNQILRSLSEMPSTKEHQINQILQQKGVHSLILKWIDFLRNNVYKC